MGKLSKEDIQKYQELYESLYNDPRILRLKDIQQHRGSNTYYHILKVTRTAYRYARRSLMHVNYEDLITGAMLHDYFLYDWRKDRSKLKRHGHRHPKIAKANAIRDFQVNKRVQNIIVSHMWPINCFHFHTCLEGHLVSLADKSVSIREALTSRKYKERHAKKVLAQLFTLEKKKL